MSSECRLQNLQGCEGEGSLIDIQSRRHHPSAPPEPRVERCHALEGMDHLSALCGLSKEHQMRFPRFPPHEVEKAKKLKSRIRVLAQGGRESWGATDTLYRDLGEWGQVPWGWDEPRLIERQKPSIKGE
jgi:hypothetical protein